MSEEKKKMEMPPREVEIKLNGETIVIGYPNVGQEIDIESKKSILSKGEYRNMIDAGTSKSNRAVALINAIATFSVLVPDFNKKLNGIKSIFDLDAIQANDLIRGYSTYFDFENKWNQFLNDELDG